MNYARCNTTGYQNTGFICTPHNIINKRYTLALYGVNTVPAHNVAFCPINFYTFNGHTRSTSCDDSIARRIFYCYIANGDITPSY